MRAAVCAILLLLALLHRGNALTCNYCKSRGRGLCNATTTQTCSRFGACAAITLPPPISTSYRSCVSKYVCGAFKNPRNKLSTCCYTDLCN